MTVESTSLPTSDALRRGLSTLLCCDTIEIVDRRPNEYSRTHPSEVIHWRVGSGETRVLLCKYSDDRRHGNVGHRRGVEHEAEVYRSVIQRSGVLTVKLYGTYKDPATGCTWLALEYLENAVTINKVPDLLGAAARWVGRFHAKSASTSKASGYELPKLDNDYYAHWSERTALFAGLFHEQFPKLEEACEFFKEVIPYLTASPTIIHGEFYPMNVLTNGGAIFPVDWESAARGAGEVDLASLTEGWPAEFSTRCELVYEQTRWPKGSPPDFQVTLAAARMYWHLRWLGDKPRSKFRKSDYWHARKLIAISENFPIPSHK